MDLADKIDEYICTIDGVGDLMMDNLAMALFGWAVGGLVVVGLAKYIYGRYVAKKQSAIAGASATSAGGDTKAVKSSVLGTSATTDDLLGGRSSREVSKDRVSFVFLGKCRRKTHSNLRPSRRDPSNPWPGRDARLDVLLAAVASWAVWHSPRGCGNVSRGRVLAPS